MELKLGYEVIDSYKRLSYKVWYAFAEFVDNSTQSYKNNEADLDKIFKEEKTSLTVEITYNNTDKVIEIKDNSIGMGIEDLANALTIGKKPENTLGRSKYGLGLKTAAFWFGDKWEIITTKYGDKKEYHVTVDLQNILDNQAQKEILLQIKDRKLTKEEGELLVKYDELDFTASDADEKSHYTWIKIGKLNRLIQTRTTSKTREYLRSMYRYDIKEGKLVLIFQGEILKWNQKELNDRILSDDSGKLYIREFILMVNGKKVTGWAGILEKGSRKDAGFSLLQAKRVIQGWPNSYRPTLLFGDQEGGTNNLVNQRLFGEIFLDGFNVSHTKDEILFSEDDEDVLDKLLFESLADYKKAAEEYRKPTVEENDTENVDFRAIVTNLFQGMQNPKFSAEVLQRDVLPQQIIMESNEEYYTRILNSGLKDSYTAEIAGIKITVTINNDSSIYEPYLVIRFRATKNELGILINSRHPHWKTMETNDIIYYFIKHCIYDGIAEWKANWLVGTLEPETIKMIKDNLLRQELNLY